MLSSAWEGPPGAPTGAICGCPAVSTDGPDHERLRACAAEFSVDRGVDPYRATLLPYDRSRVVLSAPFGRVRSP